MKTITQYKEDIKRLMSSAAEIDTRCISEGRDPTPKELHLKNEMLDEVENIRQIVITLERQEKTSAILDNPEPPVTMPAGSIEVTDLRSKDRFQSLGQQISAVIAAETRGERDPRLYNRATGLGEATASDGGYLLQSDFSTELINNVFQTGVLASRCREQMISGGANSIKINGVDEDSRATGSRGGGIRVYMADEADEKTASKPKFRRIELSLKKMVGLCYLTDELLEDVPALESFVRNGFQSEFGFAIDDQIINGVGSGQMLGILNSSARVTVTKEAGQVASTILAENIINMYARLFASSRANSAWFINQMIEPQLMKMKLDVGTGGQLIYMPPGGLSNSPYGVLLGRPVIPIEQCAALGTEGDIILADLTNGYILARKGGIKTDMSIHVKFVYDESVLRFVLRIDGQPLRSKPLTPYKGGSTATQSHFVTIETRS